MKKYGTYALRTALTVGIILGLIGPVAVFSASNPALWMTSSFGVLSSTFTNTAPGTFVTGDLGYTTGPFLLPTLTGATHVADSVYNQAGIDQGTIISDINTQTGCISLGAGAVALDGVTVGAHPPGTFPSGCYTSGGAMNITLSTTITLTGTGTFIFRPTGALNTGADSVIKLIDGASPCDVFWTPTATTFGANTQFIGTIIDDGGITFGANVNLLGRALAFGKTVTTAAGDSIAVPVCTASSSTLHIVKQLVNVGGGTALPVAFSIHVKLLWVDVIGSPATGTGSPGNTYTLTGAAYTVSEDFDTSYSQAFSGACSSTGSVTLAPGDDVTCIVTNTYIIPPIPTPVSVSSGAPLPHSTIVIPIPVVIPTITNPTPIVQPISLAIRTPFVRTPRVFTTPLLSAGTDRSVDAAALNILAPRLPNTGFDPREGSDVQNSVSIWDELDLVGVLFFGW